MSVQAGIWNFDRQPVDRSLLHTLSESLSGQGPDGECVYVDDSVALLYRPFHTTAESRREKQPRISRRGFVITWDGRLDNREELIATLGSGLDDGATDVDIVTAAFDRWESDCLSRISGDWALTIWKPEARELLFAVDYMAVRHIFYYLKNNRIWWSTNLSSLVLASGDTFQIDDDYVAGYFAYEPDAHLTPYRQIQEVPGGQSVRIRDGKSTTSRYWHFSPRSRIRYKTDAEYEEHFRHVFRQSVCRRLRSDLPILAELSGGLDSSSIVCVADDVLAKEGAQTPQLETLSFFDRSEPHGDDCVYFPKIEEKRGRVGHHIDTSKLGGSSVSLEYPDFAALPGHLGPWRDLEMEREAIMRKGGFRVVLSGIGGDEFMGGIPNPNAQLADLLLQGKFVRLAKELLAWSLVKRTPWIHLLWRAVIELLPPRVAQRLARTNQVEAWIDKGFAHRARLSMRMCDVNEYFGLWLPSRRSCLAGVFIMANKLAKLTSTLSPTENRYPYLDQDLIEFILSIPADQLLRPKERRSLMRRALVDVVPQEILDRKTKQFAARTPVVAVERNMDELQRAFESPFSATLGYVSHTQFLESLRAASRGKGIHVVRMYRTISFEFWLRDLARRRLIQELACPAAAASSAVPGWADAG